MTQQGGGWLDRFEKFGDQVAGRVADVGRQAKADIEKQQAQHSTQAAQSAAERQRLEQRRWERAQSDTWTTALEAVDTVEWARHEVVDPRSGKVAVTLRHPAGWDAGGQVMWVNEPGLSPRYAVGSGPTDKSCVAERFGRLDFITGPLVADGGGRVAVAAMTGEELVGSQVVPRLRGGNANLLVVTVKAVEAAMHTSLPLQRQLQPEAYLAAVEYDREGKPWADEMLVLRYTLPASGHMSPTLHGASVWSMAAPRDSFQQHRSTLRAIALSSTTTREWDTYVAEEARCLVVP